MPKAESVDLTLTEAIVKETLLQVAERSEFTPAVITALNGLSQTRRLDKPKDIAQALKTTGGGAHEDH